MELTQTQNLVKVDSLAFVKSFLIWTFTLGVCLVVVGFPAVVLMVAAGSILAIALQSVLPVSAVLLVAGSLIGVNVFSILLGATLLTFKGVHPNEVRWLNWLHGEANDFKNPIFAACPLTCNLVD